MVKSWSSGVQGVVVLNWSAITLDEPLRASQIARWMEICEAEGRPYELRMPGLIIRAGHGPAHMRRCLDALSMQSSTGTGSAVADELKSAPAVNVQSVEQSTFCLLYTSRCV